jgi:hypothetical protein
VGKLAAHLADAHGRAYGRALIEARAVVPAGEQQRAAKPLEAAEPDPLFGVEWGGAPPNLHPKRKARAMSNAKGKRKCRACGLAGHRKDTCPTRNGGHVDGASKRGVKPRVADGDPVAAIRARIAQREAEITKLRQALEVLEEVG